VFNVRESAQVTDSTRPRKLAVDHTLTKLGFSTGTKLAATWAHAEGLLDARSLLLVRPDGYLAARASPDKPQTVLGHLQDSVGGQDVY
jgi:hypothetical protein